MILRKGSPQAPCLLALNRLDTHLIDTNSSSLVSYKGSLKAFVTFSFNLDSCKCLILCTFMLLAYKVPFVCCHFMKSFDIFILPLVELFISLLGAPLSSLIGLLLSFQDPNNLSLELLSQMMKLNDLLHYVQLLESIKIKKIQKKIIFLYLIFI